MNNAGDVNCPEIKGSGWATVWGLPSGKFLVKAEGVWEDVSDASTIVIKIDNGKEVK